MSKKGRKEPKVVIIQPKRTEMGNKCHPFFLVAWIITNNHKLSQMITNNYESESKDRQHEFVGMRVLEFLSPDAGSISIQQHQRPDQHQPIHRQPPHLKSGSWISPLGSLMTRIPRCSLPQYSTWRPVLCL